MNGEWDSQFVGCWVLARSGSRSWVVVMCFFFFFYLLLVVLFIWVLVLVWCCFLCCEVLDLVLFLDFFSKVVSGGGFMVLPV